MATDVASAPETSPGTGRRTRRAAWWGLGIGLVLVVVCLLIHPLTDWHIVQAERDSTFPPLHGDWWPHTGRGTPWVVLMIVLAVAYAERLAAGLRWSVLLAGSYVVGVAWILALAYIDGRGEIESVLNNNNEYLGTARATTDISQMLHIYISKIPNPADHTWPVHVAGHPPGALLVFIAMVRLGLSDYGVGLAVVLIAATTALAVMTTLRVLGHEPLARRVAPFLVLTPAATTMGVSADAMFAAVVAWGLTLVAVAATRRSGSALALWAVAAGLVLGYACFLSYGFPLVGVMALGVMLVARRGGRTTSLDSSAPPGAGRWAAVRAELRSGSWLPLPYAIGAALVVAIAFSVAGFSWWKAYPVLNDRYWDPTDIAAQRPQAYWFFGDLAALLLTAGPLLAAGIAVMVVRARELWHDAATRVVLALAGSTGLVVLAADLSRMSKAEVERIWLPFMPWLTLTVLLLPPRWRRWGLLLQLVTALLVQSFVNDSW